MMYNKNMQQAVKFQETKFIFFMEKNYLLKKLRKLDLNGENFLLIHFEDEIFFRLKF